MSLLKMYERKLHNIARNAVKIEQLITVCRSLLHKGEKGYPDTTHFIVNMRANACMILHPNNIDAFKQCMNSNITSICAKGYLTAAYRVMAIYEDIIKSNAYA